MQTNVLYTHPSVRAKTLSPESSPMPRRTPGKLQFGSGGNGTPAHLAGEFAQDQGQHRVHPHPVPRHRTASCKA